MAKLPQGFFTLFYLFLFGSAGSSLQHGLSSSCGEWGLLFGALLWLLIAVAPLAAGLSSCGAGLSSCGAQLCGM